MLLCIAKEVFLNKLLLPTALSSAQKFLTEPEFCSSLSYAYVTLFQLDRIGHPNESRHIRMSDCREKKTTSDQSSSMPDFNTGFISHLPLMQKLLSLLYYLFFLIWVSTDKRT